MISNAVKDRARRAAWGVIKGLGTDLDMLGRGHFSKVYQLDDWLVLKVGGPGGYGEGDCTPSRGTSFVGADGRPQPDGWPAYIKWLDAEYDDDKPEWAPVVYHFEELRGKFYFAICEELNKYDTDGEQPNPDVDLYMEVSKAASAQGDLRMDLHDDNVMYRGNTLVINDPWVPTH